MVVEVRPNRVGYDSVHQSAPLTAASRPYPMELYPMVPCGTIYSIPSALEGELRAQTIDKQRSMPSTARDYRGMTKGPSRDGIFPFGLAYLLHVDVQETKRQRRTERKRERKRDRKRERKRDTK